MKNFSAFITKSLINRIIKSHDLGVMGNAIDEDVINEMKGIEENYLSNLSCSEETIKFIDEFISDVKKFQREGVGSNYAKNFSNNNF